MEGCTKEKAPEPERARLADELGKLRQSWQTAATISDGRNALDNACRRLQTEGERDTKGLCRDWRGSIEEDGAPDGPQHEAGYRLTEVLISSIVEKGGGYGIGIAPCDEWLRKFSRCVREKMPERARRGTYQMMAASVESWTETAATPEGRVGLEKGCRQMSVDVRAATAKYGCEW
jgi:hypothetical protein